MLVYKSRSHSKTVELVGEVVKDALKARNNNPDGIEHLTVPRNPMSEYHIGYIIEKLEEQDFNVEFTHGINMFHLHITWDDKPKYETIATALKEIESLTRNPREYEPSYYTINHIARVALGKE